MSLIFSKFSFFCNNPRHYFDKMLYVILNLILYTVSWRRKREDRYIVLFKLSRKIRSVINVLVKDRYGHNANTILNHFLCQATRKGIELDIPSELSGFTEFQANESQKAIITIHTKFAFSAEAPLRNFGYEPIWVGNVSAKSNGYNWNSAEPVRIFDAQNKFVLVHLLKMIQPNQVPVVFIDINQDKDCPAHLGLTYEVELKSNALKFVNKVNWQVYFLFAKVKEDGIIGVELLKIPDNNSTDKSIETKMDEVIRLLSERGYRSFFSHRDGSLYNKFRK